MKESARLLDPTTYFHLLYDSCSPCFFHFCSFCKLSWSSLFTSFSNLLLSKYTMRVCFFYNSLYFQETTMLMRFHHCCTCCRCFPFAFPSSSFCYYLHSHPLPFLFPVIFIR